MASSFVGTICNDLSSCVIDINCSTDGLTPVSTNEPLEFWQIRFAVSRQLSPDESMCSTWERSRMIFRKPSALKMTNSDFRAGEIIAFSFASSRVSRMYFSFLSTEYFIYDKIKQNFPSPCYFPLKTAECFPVPVRLHPHLRPRP